MVLKTTFGQSQRWSLIRGTLGVENEEKNNLNLVNEVFHRKDVFILGGLNSGIPLNVPCTKFSEIFSERGVGILVGEVSIRMVSSSYCSYY